MKKSANGSKNKTKELKLNKMETKSNKLLTKYKKIGKNKNQMKKKQKIIN